MNGNRSSLTLNDKLNLLDDFRNGLTKTELSQKYGCDKSTIWRTLRNESQIRDMSHEMNLKRKRNRKSIHKNIEEALNIWVRTERERNKCITRDMALKKAQDIAHRLQSDFTPTSTWIWRWGKRIDFKFSRSSKETNHAAEDAGDDIDSIIKCMKSDVETIPSNEDVPEDQFEDGFEKVILQQETDVNNDTQSDILYIGKRETNHDDVDNGSSSSTSNGNSRNIRKHSWLSQLVLTQIEGIHPDDRGDFAWDVHKLIRRYQQKKKLREKRIIGEVAQ